MVSMDDLTRLKKELSEKRDKGIKARATMEEIERNSVSLRENLKELGINNPDKANEEIEEMEREIEKNFNDIKNKMDKFM